MDAEFRPGESGTAGPGGEGSLDGVRIVDMTNVVMGPYATQLLADLGADVIKIESPEGDVTRRIGPMRNPLMGHLFLNTNRNKRSVMLDLKQTDQHESALRLIKTADVFVHNVRPDAMARLGLGFEEVRAHNPAIIYAAAVGYGSGGRYAGRPAYDDLIQGASGLASTFTVHGAAAPRYVPATIADRTVGLYLAACILAALFRRQRDGAAQFIEVPMFEVFSHLVLSDHLGGMTFEPQEGAPYYARMTSPDRRPYETRDGHLCVLIYNNRHWRRFVALLGRDELASDARFATQQRRADHIDEFYALVADVIRMRTTTEWIELLEQADIPVMPVHTVETLIDDPHLRDVSFFEKVKHPSEGVLRTMRAPVNWRGFKPRLRRPAPTLGEHNREVLSELGASGSCPAWDAEGADRP